MVPTTRNLLHHDSRSSKPYYPQYSCVAAQLEVASAAAACGELKAPSRLSRRVAMADDDGAEGRRRRRQEEDEAAAGTSSRGGGGDEDGGDDDGKGWLQLGLATASSSSASTSSAGDNDTSAPAPTPAPAAPTELDLFAGKQSARMTRPPLFPLPIRSYHYQYGHGRYRPAAAASGPMPAPFLPFAQPLRSCSGDLVMRVMNPPPRTVAAGLWLTLQAAPNQIREPILSQIPKSYLRIKHSNMKVEVVMKYLADKLGLSQSHQVELTCRGQLLPPFLPVKYVRDTIWCSSAPREDDDDDEVPAELQPSRRSLAATTTDHVMTLCYSTSRNHE